MRFMETELPGVILIEPDVHRDTRGFLVETFHAVKYEAAGIRGPFAQDNRSRSVRSTLRGLHLQVGRPQGKLIQVIEGEIYDVAVDVRRGSPTFGRWVGVTLSAESFKQCYVPAGFAHGFAVVSETAQVEYKCTDLYDRETELGIAWDDPELGIQWPVDRPILSDRDRDNPRLSAVHDRLPKYPGTEL
jgi:dTDP-4-dehydrorhamnose 3,5-epimerase